MVAPISALANMEMALYGGFGPNSAAPSYLNGYRGGNNYSSYGGYNNYTSAYNNYNSMSNSYNPTFGQKIPQNYSSAQQIQQSQQGQLAQQDTVFQGLTQFEQKALMNDYKASLAPSEGLLSCALLQGAFGIVQNPRLIAHPYNSIKTLGSVNEAFSDAKKAGTALNKLWVKPENSNILREAYLQMHKAEARCMSKFGAIRRSYVATGDVDAIKGVVNELKSALKAGDMEAIKKHTATLQHAYSSNGGFMPRLWNSITGSKPATVAEKLKDTTGITKKITALEKTTATSFKSILKHGGGVKGGLMFAGLELLLSWDKIKTAFGKDSETGMKQLGQTTVKAAGNAAGWALGEAAGLWAFTKLGASIGTALGPGVGTVIGGVVGLIGGGIGMWLAGKATKSIVGQDVADDIETKKLAQTNEGQAQLLQNTMQRIQSGEKVSLQAQQAVQKILAQYGQA